MPNDPIIILNVVSEIGSLKKVMIHSPDGGIGNVPSTKIHDWLYEDIVDVEQMQKEYNYFITILLLFLDIDALSENGKFSPDTVKFNPEGSNYYGKKGFEKGERPVIDTQYCLAHLFSKNTEATNRLISSISTIEGLNIDRKRDLQKLYEVAREAARVTRDTAKPTFMDLAKTFISGKLEWELRDNKLEKAKFPGDIKYIFPPIANFIFTRDIGVTIKDHIFITKPRFQIRNREVVLLKFIIEHYLLRGRTEKIIELGEDDDFFQMEDRFKDENRVSFEGGDIMMISEEHVLIGCSQRTSPYAIQKLIHKIFRDGLVKLVSVIKISEKRSQMHIDTILSQLRKDLWIIFGQLSEDWQKKQKAKASYQFEYADWIRQKSANQLKKEKLVTITQLYCHGDYDRSKNYRVYSKDEIDFMLLKKEISKKEEGEYQTYEELRERGFKYTKPIGLKDLLRQISVNDFGVKRKKDVKFIYSGGGVPPHDEREQWTDACNLLVIREGIAIGYDRNKKTAEAFEDLMLGIDVEELEQKVRDEALTEEDFKAELKKTREEIRRSKIEEPRNRHVRDFLKWLMQTTNRERRKQNRYEYNEEAELDFHVIHAKDLIEYFRDELKFYKSGSIQSFVRDLDNTLILLPSAELSRARGGSHCMTMPLLRDGM